MLAERAYQEKTGARGLLSVFEELLIRFEKKLPSTDIKELHVDNNLIKEPAETLKQLLLTDGIKSFQEEFMVEHGTFLDFTPEASAEIGKIAGEKKLDIKKLCKSLFADYYHGMRLMNLESFTINQEAVKKPSGLHQ